MKKKFVAIVMAAMMMMSLAACGDDTGASAPAPSTTPAENNTQSAAGQAEGNMVSDDTFAILQENYALMLEYHDLVAATYNSDEIAANPEIEATMGQAADLIAQMGEVKQDMLSEEDAVAFNDLMIGVVEALTGIVDSMEITGDAGGAQGTAVTDETFEILQTNWATLTELYNQAATAYNNGEYEKNEAFEAMMNEAADILEQIAAISKDNTTQEDAVAINDTMIQIQEQLAEALGLTG